MSNTTAVENSGRLRIWPLGAEQAEIAANRYGSIHLRWGQPQRSGTPCASLAAVRVSPIVNVVAQAPSAVGSGLANVSETTGNSPVNPYPYRYGSPEQLVEATAARLNRTRIPAPPVHAQRRWLPWVGAAALAAGAFQLGRTLRPSDALSTTPNTSLHSLTPKPTASSSNKAAFTPATPTPRATPTATAAEQPVAGELPAAATLPIEDATRPSVERESLAAPQRPAAGAPPAEPTPSKATGAQQRPPVTRKPAPQPQNPPRSEVQGGIIRDSPF